MKQLFFISSVLLVLSTQTWAQDPRNAPRPPLAELKKFNPYTGVYNVTSIYNGQEWKGTLEWGPVIKNWYLQSTIRIRHGATGFDREFRLMMTWDSTLQKYRLWRFETTEQKPPESMEGEAKFVAGELVNEWHWKDEKGPYTFRNRMKMLTPNKLQIISEEEEAGKVTQVGVTTCTRIAAKKKYTL